MKTMLCAGSPNLAAAQLGESDLKTVFLSIQMNKRVNENTDGLASRTIAINRTHSAQ
mgnify:CR=1 FL=1